MLALLTRIAASALVLGGLVVLPLPVPLGILMVVMGLALFLSCSVTALRLLRRWRRTHPETDLSLRRLRPRLPGFFARALRRSEPRPKLALPPAAPPEAS